MSGDLAACGTCHLLAPEKKAWLETTVCKSLSVQGPRKQQPPNFCKVSFHVSAERGHAQPRLFSWTRSECTTGKQSMGKLSPAISRRVWHQKLLSPQKERSLPFPGKQDLRGVKLESIAGWLFGQCAARTCACVPLESSLAC